MTEIPLLVVNKLEEWEMEGGLDEGGELLFYGFCPIAMLAEKT